MNGPSFTSDTCIDVRNRPEATCAFRLPSWPATASTNGSASSGPAAWTQDGRRPRDVSAYSVNWLTTSTGRESSSADRFALLGVQAAAARVDGWLGQGREIGEDKEMPAWICATCAVQYPDTEEPPAHCPICEDERQYVGWQGQRWTTARDLVRDHRSELREEEPNLIGVGIEPAFGIGQRALLVCTPQGNVLWDCVALIDDAACRQILELGGVDVICMSHPHFYGANIDIADAFDARVLVPRADRDWIARPSPRIELFDDEAEPIAGLTLARIGGHFDGAAVLHWPAGAGQRGVLLTGDTITVVQDRDWVSFMWSYPNLIPLDERTVLDIAARVERFSFDRVYGGWWGRVVVEDGARAIRRSAERYVARLRGERPSHATHGSPPSRT